MESQLGHSGERSRDPKSELGKLLAMLLRAMKSARVEAEPVPSTSALVGDFPSMGDNPVPFRGRIVPQYPAYMDMFLHANVGHVGGANKAPSLVPSGAPASHVTPTQLLGAGSQGEAENREAPPADSFLSPDHPVTLRKTALCVLLRVLPMVAQSFLACKC